MGQEFAPQFLVGLDFQVHTVSIADQIRPFGFIFYLLNIRNGPFYQQLALERVLEVAEKLVLIIGVLLGESAGKYFHTGIEKFQWLDNGNNTEQFTRIFCCWANSSSFSLVTKLPLKGSLLFADSVITILHMFLSLRCFISSFKFNSKLLCSFFFLLPNRWLRA